MKQNQIIAIPTNEGMLWPHFGKAPQVTIVIDTIEYGDGSCHHDGCGGHHHHHE